MNPITKEQLYTRWDSLPDILREAITSETNSGIVLETARGEHLHDEKSAIVSKLTGYVLMGFIHPEELADEIKNELGIDARIATAIAEPIQRKIFNPLREELESIYAPPGEEPKAPAPVMPGGPPPAMMEEVTAAKGLETIETEATKEEKAAAPSFPVVLPAKTDVPPSRETPPRAEAAPAPEIPAPSGAIPSAPQPQEVPKPAKPQAPSGAEPPAVSAVKPFILHEEMEIGPTAPAKTGISATPLVEQFGKLGQTWTPPPKPAKIETASTVSPPAAPVPSRAEERVVHYSEMKTPLPPKPPVKPGAPGARNMFEETKKRQI